MASINKKLKGTDNFSLGDLVVWVLQVLYFTVVSYLAFLVILGFISDDPGAGYGVMVGLLPLLLLISPMLLIFISKLRDKKQNVTTTESSKNRLKWRLSVFIGVLVVSVCVYALGRLFENV